VGWKSTLNRLELPGGSQRYHKIDYAPEKIDALLCDLYIESHAEAPDQIVLDLDATDIPLHGHQPERFFHGYYDSYCYLPLYIFAGDQLLCARLRPSNVDGAAGALDEVKRIVAQLRARWPKVRIVLRGDSGFCREELMAWCEAAEICDEPLRALAEPTAKPISSRCMALPVCFAPPPAIKSIPCEKWRLEAFCLWVASGQRPQTLNPADPEL
jgi:hypothetical protein